MTEPHFSMRAPATPVVRYGLAVVSVALALGIKLILLQVGFPYPLTSSFLVAIAVSFWFGRTGPGILAVLLSLLAFGYFVMPYQLDYRLLLPDGSTKPVYLPIDVTTTLPYLIYFALVALLMSWFSSSRRRAEGLLNQARNNLELKVEKRTADLRHANQELQAEVTDRKRVEAALKERAHLLDLTHDSVFVRDMNSVITYWNRGAEIQYGWTSEEAVGQVSHNIIQTVFPAPLDVITEELTRTGRWEGELVHTRRDDTQVVVASRWALQCDDQGNALAILETNNDITKRKRTEDALHKAEAELTQVERVMTIGELVVSIAHELNQPLGAIVTNGYACLRLLSREAPDLGRSREVIERMIKEGMRASDVIKRIRDLLPKNPPEEEPLNINETIQEVVGLVGRDVLSNKITLVVKLAAYLPPVLGDRIQLRHVILNLILNAKEAMSTVQGQPRELMITTRRSESGEVLVAVRDSGVGLDPKSVDRIFDPFFSTKPEALGLGLSISRTIIETHGGTLWATQNEGAGATIQFSLKPASGSES